MSYVKIDTSEHTIETDRLILRFWKEKDLKDFNEYAKEKGVGEMAGWFHHESLDKSREILSSFIENKSDFALILKETGKVIGSFGFHESKWVSESAYKNLKYTTLGYVLSKSYWGKGLMPEAVNAVIKYLFDNTEIEAIAISHFKHNEQSKRVIEKVGFIHVMDGTQMSKMGIEFEDKKYILLKNNFNKFMKEATEKL